MRDRVYLERSSGRCWGHGLRTVTEIYVEVADWEKEEAIAKLDYPNLSYPVWKLRSAVGFAGQPGD